MTLLIVSFFLALCSLGLMLGANAAKKRAKDREVR